MKIKARTIQIVLAITVVLGLTAATGCSVPAEAQAVHGSSVPRRESDGTVPAPVRVMTITRTTFVEYGEYVGEARGFSEARLTASAGGRVSAITATEGMVVAAGQSLGEIDTPRADTIYRTAQLNERLARETWEREQRFLAQGNSFQLKVDQAELAWLQAHSALLDAERMRDAAYARTPIGGTVVRTHIRQNDDLEAGDPTFDVADLSRIRITLGVPEADIAGVRHLDSAEVVFPAYPDRVFSGVPAGFARARSERTLSYAVDVLVDNPDGTILSGQTARVRLALKQYPDVIAVPSSAIITRDNRTYLMVVRDGAVRETAVTAGAAGETHTVILSGVHAGEQIVTEGFNRLANRAAVEIVD